jgi:hypothetical protein
MKLFILVLICLSFCFCSSKSDKETTVIIYNNSKITIDSIQIVSYGMKEIFKTILPQNEVEKKVTVKYSGKFSGGFGITIFEKDSVIKSTTFGYFENGSAIKNRYKIEIGDGYSIKERNQ